VGFHHWRHRLCGPEHPLLVARCAVHGRAFTIYPPGFAPYERRPVLDIPPDGSVSAGQKRNGLTGSELEGTLFEASRDSAQRVAWRPSGPAFSTGRWRTQNRHLRRATHLLGLDSATTPQQRQEIARLLNVPTMDLQRISSELARGPPGYRARGHAVISALGLLRLHHGLAEDLLRCGVAAEVWPAPMFYR